MSRESHSKAPEKLKVSESGSLEPDLVSHCPAVRCNHLFGHLKARCEEDKCFPGLISASESLTLWSQVLAGAHPTASSCRQHGCGVLPAVAGAVRLQTPPLCPSSAGWSLRSSGKRLTRNRALFILCTRPAPWAMHTRGLRPGDSWKRVSRSQCCGRTRGHGEMKGGSS